MSDREPGPIEPAVLARITAQIPAGLRHEVHPDPAALRMAVGKRSTRLHALTEVMIAGSPVYLTPGDAATWQRLELTHKALRDSSKAAYERWAEQEWVYRALWGWEAP